MIGTMSGGWRAHDAPASAEVVAGLKICLYCTIRTWPVSRGLRSGCRPAGPESPCVESGDMGGLVISGGRVVDPASGMDAIGDVAVLDGRIAAVGTGLGG